MKQQIEGIPDGYEMIAYRQPVAGDTTIMNDGTIHEWQGASGSAPFPILKKIDAGRPMSEFPMDQYGEAGHLPNCLFYVDGEWVEGYGVPAKFVTYEDSEEIQPQGWKPKDE